MRRALLKVSPHIGGRAVSSVTPCFSQSVADDLGIERIDVVTTCLPRQSTVQIVMVNPNEWKKGRMPRTISSGNSCTCCPHLMDVAQDVPMRQHHPFGVARRTRRENHGRRRVEVVVAQPRERLPKAPIGTTLRPPRPRACRRGRPARDVRANQRPLGPDLELVEHLGRGQDVGDPALVDRRIDQLWLAV